MRQGVSTAPGKPSIAACHAAGLAESAANNASTKRAFALSDPGQELIGAAHRAEGVETTFQKRLQLGQAGGARRAAHQPQGVAQQGLAHKPVERQADVERELESAAARCAGAPVACQAAM